MLFGVCYICRSVAPVEEKDGEYILSGHRIPGKPKTERCSGAATSHVGESHAHLKSIITELIRDHECFEDEGIESPYDDHHMGIFAGMGDEPKSRVIIPQFLY